jgi:hypothetical protein
MASNPYQSPLLVIDEDERTFFWRERFLFVAWLALCFYPVIASGSFYVLWLVHYSFGYRGPIDENYSPSMKLLMTVIMAINWLLIVGTPFFGPIGLCCSFFSPTTFKPITAKCRRLLPTLVLASWAAVFDLMRTDPGRIFFWCTD